MSVGFTVGFYWYQVGTGDFLHAFFSTIAYNVEKNKWGSRFPIIMNDLYNGTINAVQIVGAINELDEIANELRKYPVNKVVWDIDDLSLMPPWGDRISSSITDLSNYFVTSDGEDLITILKRALEKGLQLNLEVKITSI